MIDRPKSPPKMLPLIRPHTAPNMFIVDTRGSFGSAARNSGWWSGGTLIQAIPVRITGRDGQGRASSFSTGEDARAPSYHDHTHTCPRRSFHAEARHVA